MARETIEYPTGVSQDEFDAHTHNYRKLTRVGVDTKKGWTSPNWEDVVDGGDTHVAGNTDIEAAGITVTTSPTGPPIP